MIESRAAEPAHADRPERTAQRRSSTMRSVSRRAAAPGAAMPAQPAASASAPPPPRRPCAARWSDGQAHEEKEPDNARFPVGVQSPGSTSRRSRCGMRRSEPMAPSPSPRADAKWPKPKDDPSIQQQQPDRPPGRQRAWRRNVPGLLSMRNPGRSAPSRAEQEARPRARRLARPRSPRTATTARKGDGALEAGAPASARRSRAGRAGRWRRDPPDVPTSSRRGGARAARSAAARSTTSRTSTTATRPRWNSKRWLLRELLHRLKRQVAQNWDPKTRCGAGPYPTEDV